MYLYFDKQGNLKEQINDEGIRQGNQNINKLYIFWEDAENRNTLGVWYRFVSSASDGFSIPKDVQTPIKMSNTTVTQTIPYDPKRDLKYFKYNQPYKFYVVDFENDEDVLNYGNVSWLASLWFVVDKNDDPEDNQITVEDGEVVSYDDSQIDVIGMGAVAFFVAGVVQTIVGDENISLAQWNYLIGLYTTWEQHQHDLDDKIDELDTKVDELEGTVDLVTPRIEALESAIATKVDEVKINGITQAKSLVDNKVIVSLDLSAYATNLNLKTYAKSLEVSINQSTYVATFLLKDADGNIISTQTLDFPIESMVVSGSYDSQTKSIILTLQNGNTTSIPVGDLVDGLVSNTQLTVILGDYYTKTQVYNKTEIDSLLNINYVDKTTSQTIIGQKTFIDDSQSSSDRAMILVNKSDNTYKTQISPQRVELINESGETKLSAEYKADRIIVRQDNVGRYLFLPFKQGTIALVGESYTKAEEDALLNAKADTDDVYSKTDIDTLLNAKANTSDVYTKAESDSKYVALTGNQTISGVKTFSRVVVKNEDLWVMNNDGTNIAYVTNNGFILWNNLDIYGNEYKSTRYLDDRIVFKQLIGGETTTKTLNIPQEDGTLALVGESYTKAQTDTLLNAKANASDVYTKAEINTSLSGKVSSNTAITGATKCKITYDSKGLVTGGADLSASDIPDLSSIYALNSALNNYLLKTDATTTATADKVVKRDGSGNIEGNYIQGAWLKSTNATEIGNSWQDVWVNDGNGWLYKRSKANFKADLGIPSGTLTTKENLTPTLLGYTQNSGLGNLQFNFDVDLTNKQGLGVFTYGNCNILINLYGLTVGTTYYQNCIYRKSGATTTTGLRNGMLSYSYYNAGNNVMRLTINLYTINSDGTIGSIDTSATQYTAYLFLVNLK